VIKKISNNTLRLLRWSEKYTKTDMVYLTKGGFWIVFFQIVAALTGFFVTVTLTNILPKSTFGEYKYVFSVHAVLTIFTLPGIAEALIRKVAVDKMVNIYNYAKVKIKWGMLGLVSALALSIYYYIKDNDTLGLLFLIVAVLMPFTECFSVYISFFKGKGDFKTFSVYMTISNLFQAGLVIIVAILTQNIFWISGALLSSQIVSRYYFFKRTINKHEEVNYKKDNDDTIRFGQKLTGTQLLNRLINQVDKLLIWHYFSAGALAAYTVALVVPQATSKIVSFIPQIALPKFSNRDWTSSNERKALYKKISFYFLVLLIPFAIYIIIAPYFYKIFFPDYLDSVKVSMVLASLIIFIPIKNLLHQVMLSAEKVREITIYKTFELVSYIVIFFLLLFNFGEIIYVLAIAFPVKLFLTILLQLILINSWRPSKGLIKTI
jgi:O-antigen/teichoic acid export membrane protein